MLLFLILTVIPFLFIEKLENNQETLSYQQTTIINGFFTLLIFLSHSTQYYELSYTIINRCYRFFQGVHNQWVVATFMAFSGYGVMLKIKVQRSLR